MPLFGPPNVDKMKAKKDIKGLIKALDYPKDPSVCAAASQALVDLRGSAVEPLITALSEEDQELRQVVIRTLVRIDKPAVEPLIAALRSYATRKGALEALQKISGLAVTRAVGRLLADIEGADDQVRGEAIEALAEIGEPAVEMLITSLSKQSLNALKVPVNMVILMTATSDAIPHHQELVTRLNEALQDKGLNARAAIASTLGKIRDRRAIEPLTTALEEDDLFLRWSAAGALFKLGNPQALAPLSTLQDEDLLIEGISLLKLIGDGSTVKPWIAGLEDEDPSTRQTSREGLMKLGWKPG